MKNTRYRFVALTVFIFVTGAPAQDMARKTDWRGQYAYSLGMQAYIFGFPYVYPPSEDAPLNSLSALLAPPPASCE